MSDDKMSDDKKIYENLDPCSYPVGACEFGVKDFCESNEVPKKLSVKECIELTNGCYGNKQFEKFFKESKE
jgi:hypothetical protein